MRGTLLLALFLTALFPLNSALADRVAFPPDNCSGANPFMAFDGVTTGGNTYCINGQSVLNNALLPGCNDGQAVTYEGGKFICKTVSTDTPPTCSAGQFLTYNGTSFSCGSTNVPTCQANYVLTYNGSAFTCVPKSASVPTCAANQFLTYNGTSFQCAATQAADHSELPQRPGADRQRRQSCLRGAKQRGQRHVVWHADSHRVRQIWCALSRRRSGLLQS